jgi:hypothetical protein
MLKLITQNTAAQNLLFTPYLEIEDNFTHNKDRLKENTAVFIKTQSENTPTRDIIYSFRGDSIVITKKHGSLKLSDIEQISFKSIKPKRSVKQVLTLSAGIIEGLLIWELNQAVKTEPTGSGGPGVILFLAVVTPPIALASVAVSGWITHLSTPITTVNRSEVEMRIVR